eukprot:6458120-Prymnesium_polylepis.1
MQPRPQYSPTDRSASLRAGSTQVSARRSSEQGNHFESRVTAAVLGVLAAALVPRVEDLVVRGARSRSDHGSMAGHESGHVHHEDRGAHHSSGLASTTWTNE